VALTYLLDSDICIEALRRRSVQVLERLRRHSPRDIAVSAISEGELRFGALKSGAPARNGAAVDALLRPFQILPFGRECVPAYAKLRFELDSAGMRIGALDQLIAAQAIALGLIVVTNNVREFGRVPGLRIENWLS
jgi:tRNA(fMet)-specific endonuclease VapC